MLTLIPHYKRPEVLEITAAQLPDWVEPIYALSPTDQFLEQNKAILNKHGYEWILTENEPLNFKMNELTWHALESNPSAVRFMYLNSDTLINPSYKSYLVLALTSNTFQRAGVIGTNDLFITDQSFSKAAHYKYPIDYCLGSGRIVRREVLEKIWPPFPGNQNSGIDGLFAKNCKKHGINHTVVDTATVPMICDIKTQTNLTPYDVLSNKKDAESIDWETIEKYFYDNS